MTDRLGPFDAESTPKLFKLRTLLAFCKFDVSHKQKKRNRNCFGRICAAYVNSRLETLKCQPLCDAQ